jgi:hypothetical protein
MLLFLTLAALLAASAPAGSTARLGLLPPPERGEKMARDGRALEILIAGIESTMARGRQQGLLGLAGKGQRAVPERERLRAFFATFLDYAVALDSFRGFYEARGDLNEAEAAEAFLLAYAAELALYVNTAELLKDTTGRRAYEVILDEPVPEFGVSARAWRSLKTAFNLRPWQRPLVLAHGYHRRLANRYARHGIRGRQAALFGYIDRRVAGMVKLGATAGPSILVREWSDLAGAGFQRIWFPAQKGVAEWMGDTSVRRIGRALIQPEQVAQMRPALRPGDILVERRNWYLSNVGLPGFWPHTALYLGTPEELGATLGAEAVERLRRDHPAAFGAWDQADAAGHPHRVLEAVSEGVIFSSLEHTAEADYLAVIRPRLTPEEISGAIHRAFAYFGRPYDFDFDFLTDRALVCSELVYKAFEAQPGRRGLRLPLVQVLGRPTLPPNEIVRLFDAEADRSDRQLDFVYFLDGREREGRAAVADAAAFRSSHRRSKWDLAQP